MVALDQIYQKSPDIVFRRVADAAILVPIRQRVADLNAIYNLNDAAAFIWELLDGVHTLGAILIKVTETYEVDEATAKEDLFSLVTSLSKENAVSIVSKES